MRYSDDPEMVRVDFFKASGKWYCTEAVRFSDYNEPDIHFAFAKALREHFKNCPDRLSDMMAVCLEPYHKNEHPLMLTSGAWLRYLIPWNQGG